MKTLSCLFLTSVSAVACASANTSSIKKDFVPEINKPQILSYESDASGFHTKSFLVVSGNESALIDTQFTPAHAQKALESFSKNAQSALKYAIATHPNPDKFNGAAVAQAQGAKFVVSQATAKAMPEVHAYKSNFFVKVAKMFQEKDYPVLAKPDMTFLSTQSIQVGKIHLELTEMGASGVSSNQTVVYIPEAKALFVGDLVHHKAHAWLEGGIVNGKATPALNSWIEVLKTLKSKYPQDTFVYGGRGEPGLLADVVDAQISYLQKADALVHSYIDALGTRKSELFTAQAGQHFEILTRQFEKEWPSFQFPYLIQYGVYGLAQAKVNN